MNPELQGGGARRTRPSAFEEALGHAYIGRGIGREDALVLASEAPLDALLCAATAVRAQAKGNVVSYSKKVFIPLTTLCRDYCSYCTFRRDPGQAGAHFMTPDEVLELAEKGSRAGCKEALFSLGDQPERIFPEARGSLLRERLALYPEYVKRKAFVSSRVRERLGRLADPDGFAIDGSRFPHRS
jgi:2-iminoacetate synthase ThiH